MSDALCRQPLGSLLVKTISGVPLVVVVAKPGRPRGNDQKGRQRYGPDNDDSDGGFVWIAAEESGVSRTSLHADHLTEALV